MCSESENVILSRTKGGRERTRREKGSAEKGKTRERLAELILTADDRREIEKERIK